MDCAMVKNMAAVPVPMCPVRDAANTANASYQVAFIDSPSLSPRHAPRRRLGAPSNAT
jgi:hypothetical protein